MHYSVAVLLTLLHVLTVASAAPLSAETVKMKSKVKWMAEQVVVRINTDFQVPSGLTVSASVNDNYAPSSIVMVLEGFNSLISDSFNRVAQVKSDISSLTGYLDQWSQVHCSEQRLKPSVPGPLQELQTRKQYIHTVSVEALMRVKEYLNQLLKNLDHLQTC